MFAYLTSLHEPLQHNMIEYIYDHYLTLMIGYNKTIKKKKKKMFLNGMQFICTTSAIDTLGTHV